MAKQILEPLKVFPDSTESYNLSDFIKWVKVYYTTSHRSIKKSNARKIVRARLELDKLREYKPRTRLSKRKQALIMSKLAKTILSTRNVSLHERNKLLNVPIFISTTKYQVRQKVKHRLSDLPLYLLYAATDKPIHGRISMTKQVFLLIKEVLGEKNVENAKFVPYRYGPYSFLLTHVLSNLEYDGLLKVRGRKNTSSEKFLLTEKGMKVTKKKFSKLSKSLREEILDRRKGWDEDHIGGILAYVYNKYPEFTEKSQLKKKYKSITWGKARG